MDGSPQSEDYYSVSDKSPELQPRDFDDAVKQIHMTAEEYEFV